MNLCFINKGGLARITRQKISCNYIFKPFITKNKDAASLRGLRVFCRNSKIWREAKQEEINKNKHTIKLLSSLKFNCCCILLSPVRSFKFF